MMNRNFRTKIAISLFVPTMTIGMSSFATAADTKTSTGQTQATGTDASATNTRQGAHAFREMRASKLIGSDVRNAQNENLGEIKDLVVDVNNGRVYYAVLSFGGFLGVGDKLFAYPIKVFSPSADGDKLILNLDKARLKAAPGFESKQSSNWNVPTYRAQVDRYFGPTVTVKPMPNQLLRQASDLIGKNVNDRNGKDVGEIDDLVVNMNNGKIHYAVLAFDKSWNLNDKVLAVPLSAFTFSADHNDLVMNVDRSKLDTKLAFDKKKWPDINDPKYIVDVDRYLVVVVPAGGSANTTAMNKGKTATGESPESMFARLDTNGDGKLSTAEAAKDAKVMGMWKQMDKDNDGTVSKAEFMDFMSAHQQATR